MNDLDTRPRGIRNNNPGNIDRSDPRAGWLGAVSADQLTDPRFEQFTDPLYGLRALGRVLYNYQRKDGCETIKDFAYRWAPRSTRDEENDSDAYARHLAAVVKARTVFERIDISDPALLVDMMRGIVSMENGLDTNGQPYPDPYSDALYLHAAALAQG